MGIGFIFFIVYAGYRCAKKYSIAIAEPESRRIARRLAATVEA
jgi:hypothetical protein